MPLPVLIYSSVERKPTIYARVVELVDSLDSGSSVHCGRAGSSPASRTKKYGYPIGYPLFFCLAGLEEGGLGSGKATKCPVDAWLARGKVHPFRIAPLVGVS